MQHRISQTLSAAAALLLLLLMFITVVDVIGRYVFNQPLAGSSELTEICLSMIIFAAFPLLCRNNDHIAVDLLENRFSAQFKRLRDRVVQVVVSVCLLTLTYGLFLLGMRARRDVLVTEILELPNAVFLFVMAFLLLLSVAFSVRILFRRDGNESGDGVAHDGGNRGVER
ncbi:MAG: TRAP transporter small permease [Gammaproteobacteria bacterium]|nr:TRAP transporter small permease [Gammaproteobacteria bacterium]